MKIERRPVSVPAPAKKQPDVSAPVKKPALPVAPVAAKPAQGSSFSAKATAAAPRVNALDGLAQARLAKARGGVAALANGALGAAHDGVKAGLAKAMEGGAKLLDAAVKAVEKFGPANDKVAVFDNFGGKDVSHGAMVADVIRDNAPVDVTEQRLVEVKFKGDTSSLEALVESRTVGMLDATTAAIDALLANPGAVSVVNQSQSWSGIKSVNAILESRAKGTTLPASKTPDLASPSHAAELQAVVDGVTYVLENSPKIAAARARYEAASARLEAANIVHVVAAGNQAEDVAALEAKGVKVPASLSTSVLANGRQLVVGASEGGVGSKVAGFSNRTTLLSTTMDGVAVDALGSKVDGTSFAAPQVAAVVSRLREINPELSVAQVRDLIRVASVDGPAAKEAEGAGALNKDVAVGLGYLSLLPTLARRVVP